MTQLATMTLGNAGRDPGAVLAELLAATKRAQRYNIGFPGATDLEFPELAEWLTTQLLNNIGDPTDPGHGQDHTKTIERQVIDIVADLMRAPPSRWGYVTGGASEGTEHALDEAGQHLPDVVAYASTAAHYSVVKAARRLKLPLIQVRAEADGRMDLADLAHNLVPHRDRPAMIVATAGTTMSEAIDDVAAIAELCDDLGVLHRRIHVDAALSGIPLALLPDEQRPAFDFAAGATSMVVSGHKFLGTLMPCAVLVYARSPYPAVSRRVPYTGSLDTTIGGSRSGHTPLLLWSSLTRLGLDGHRSRAEAARELASYTCEQLTSIGWYATRNPYAFTVVFDPPPTVVQDKWVLADDGHRAHIITMPGIHVDQIDEFVSDLRAATRSTRTVPRPADRVAPVLVTP